MRRIAATALLCAGVLLSAITPVQAAFHFMVIEEVYAGHPGRPGAHYVVLRMTSSGQIFVGGQTITTFLADGTPGPAFGTFTQHVDNGAFGSRILMATQEALEMFGIDPEQGEADQVVTGRLPAPSGKICFAGTVDCVAYGDFTGSNLGFGMPAVAIQPAMSLHRTNDGSNNSADFMLAPPEPRNNAGDVFGDDFDGDLVPDFSDCAPADSSLWFAPGEVTEVEILPGAQSMGLVWNQLNEEAGEFTVHDVMMGTVSAFRAAGGFVGAVTCAARDLPGGNLRISGFLPLPGDADIYLVRGRNGCGVGTYGDGTESPDPRDLLDKSATDPCAPGAGP